MKLIDHLADNLLWRVPVITLVIYVYISCIMRMRIDAVSGAERRISIPVLAISKICPISFISYVAQFANYRTGNPGRDNECYIRAHVCLFNEEMEFTVSLKSVGS